MKYSFELKTQASDEKIWALYADVDQWFSWESNLEDISLDGEFVEGTSGEMKLTNQPAFQFELVSVIPNKEFINMTTIPTVGEIHFIHQLASSNDETIVRHSVEFIPCDRAVTVEDTSMISQIFSDVPASVFNLVDQANE